MTSIPSRQHDRYAAWRWGAIVVGLLGMQVALGIAAILLATGDRSVAVIPDYHQKALDWDQEIALRSASRELGWQVTCRQTVSDTGANGLQMVVSDKAGRPIRLASGSVQLYHKARASEVYSVDVPKSDQGRIVLGGCFDHHGVWQLRVDVTDDSGRRFVESNTLVVEDVGDSSFGVD
jgi:nitrogen fixation protein FixH